jgi:signal transduction histidine kinase
MYSCTNGFSTFQPVFDETVGIVERGNFYEFTIADDGPGIAPDRHDRVFEIFQAVNPQNRADSTGIGLALAEPTGGNRQKNHRSRGW